MNYIVFDLEWNQSPNGKKNSVADMPFEIIQIGAVKVNSEFQITEEFNRFIKPKEYLQLHSKVREILGITMKDLEHGDEFQRVIDDFMTWCGNDYMFCTWGSMDLVELQRNMKHFGVEIPFPMPFLFYDLQKLYSLCYSDGKSRITLQHAIEERGIVSDDDYHHAVNDARYTAKVLQNMDFDKVKEYVSVDTYRIPSSKKEEIALTFGDYAKYISRGFVKREAAASDREVRSCKCFLCGNNMRRVIKWFATNGKNYYGLFECEEHGLVKGRFKTKQADNGKYYTVKIMKLTDEEGAEKIKQRQVREREHRKMKRHAQTIHKNEQ